jgi:hypothetical protein
MMMEMNIKNIIAAISSSVRKLKSRVSFSQLKPILDIFLRGVSCPQHIVKFHISLIPLALKSYVGPRHNSGG